MDMGIAVGTPHVVGQIEAAFTQQSRLATAILQNMPVIGFLLDEEGVFVESVGSGLGRLGRKDHGLVGEQMQDVCPGTNEWVRRALSGESVHFESQGTIDGRPWAFDTMLVFDEVRRSGAVGFSIDITERKQSKQRLEKQRAELAHIARVKTIEEMVTSIAHELNQPLAAVVMQAEVTARKMQLGRAGGAQELIESLGCIADEAYRAGQIIQRMKDFVRKTEPRRSSIDLFDIVCEAVALVENDLRHASITCDFDLDPSLPKVLVDAIQVQQVLLHLIRNAMEAIELAGSGRREITVRAKAQNGAEEVAVCDTGCGISEQHLSRYFDTFYTTKPDGMGLGLPISRSIIEAHGGRIWGKRNPDRGATFTFSIPIPRKDQQDAV